MVDVAAVPIRFKQRIGKPEHHHVLGGLFSKVVVDPVGIFLLESAVDHFVQMVRTLEIFSKRLFANHTRPFPRSGFVQARRSKLLHDLVKELRSRREVKETIGSRAPFFVELIEFGFEAFVAFRVLKLASVIVNGLSEATPEFVAVALAGVLLVGRFQFGPEHVIRFVPASKSDHLELRRQVATGRDIVERGDQLSVGQIARGSENDKRARLRTIAVKEGFLKGVFHWGGWEQSIQIP